MLKRDTARLGENALLRACRMWQYKSVEVLLQYYDMENCNDRTLTVFGAVRRKTTRLLAENLQISEEQTESKNKDNSHDSWNGKFDAFTRLEEVILKK